MNKEYYPEELKYSFTPRVAGLADIKYAPIISDWTEKAGTMLPKTPQQIVELFLQDRSAIVVNALGEVVSHAATSYIYSDGSIEFGALVTGEVFKGKGAAALVSAYLLGDLGNKYPGRKIFALANSMSSKLFEKLGGVVTDHSSITKEAWDSCRECKNNPNPPKEGEVYVFKGCCDIPYDLTNVALSIAHR